ncbi:MAG: hypothetical protein ACRYE9_04170 [Janthinobacterium lividum]
MMVKFEFNKLVRNKLIKRFQEQKIIVNGLILTPDQFIEKLREKIIEEAQEVCQARKQEDLLTEFADLLEVIDALAKACAIDYKDIEEAKVKKREVNGYFSPESYINNILVDKNNTKVMDYLKSKNRSYKLEH